MQCILLELLLNNIILCKVLLRGTYAQRNYSCICHVSLYLCITVQHDNNMITKQPNSYTWLNQLYHRLTALVDFCRIHCCFQEMCVKWWVSESETDFRSHLQFSDSLFYIFSMVTLHCKIDFWNHDHERKSF